MGYIIPLNARRERPQRRSFLAISRQRLRPCSLAGEAQHSKKLSRAVIKWERSLLQQSVIFPHLSAANQLEAAAGQVGLRRRGKTGCRGMLADALITQFGANSQRRPR